ncbi:hypothetical protein JYP49_16110 [Nitratireductor aquimarinus]|uniref:hypothetical protein n=1 Tax=Nitratireductor TaxID=245876 RepID=UPI0019D3AC85|nr:MULTISPECIES: hypothetical protein [Nitratireductor]MBN7777797.1 hypothetical protein [Nitratireductor pacificus]MBN7782119.1 hypothetical protein [Nitratireductor pacificus]MBN7790926.1 hypothetical protein [Nitratireductor aquimarinus]MBY6100007.1 hypothetical protein [Nitratireductor aquimarinus]MCA1262183.1 hypothetical protein [Nitratireductor aquimarinus]
MNFEKPDRKARLVQLGFLVRHTFSIVGRNRALLSPLIAMWVYATAMVTMFFIGFLLIAYGSAGSSWFLFGGVVMFIYKFFFYNRAELVLSRLTFDTATGRSPTQRDARRLLSGLGPQVRRLALLDMAAAWIASRKDKQGGLMALLLGGIGELWDLVNHFLLPAVAVDRLGLQDGVARLKRLKDHVPEALIGVFGIDIMGGVVGTLMAPLYVFGGLAAIACGLLFGERLPTAFSAGPLYALSPDIPNIGPFGPETVFNWLPVFMTAFLGFILHGLLARVVTAIKVVYFTLFYSRIWHAAALDPDMRVELEGYLDLNEQEVATADATT